MLAKFVLLMWEGLECIIRDVLQFRLSPEAWLDNDDIMINSSGKRHTV